MQCIQYTCNKYYIEWAVRTMFVKALRSKKMKRRLGKTFNLSYHMINSDNKS